MKQVADTVDGMVAGQPELLGATSNKRFLGPQLALQLEPNTLE